MGETSVAVAQVAAEITLSEARALAESVKTVKQAEAKSLESALKKEANMCDYIQDEMATNQDTVHLMTFLWSRLVEQKITDGVNVSVIVNNPLFAQ